MDLWRAEVELDVAPGTLRVQGPAFAPLAVTGDRGRDLSTPVGTEAPSQEWTRRSTIDGVMDPHDSGHIVHGAQRAHLKWKFVLLRALGGTSLSQ